METTTTLLEILKYTIPGIIVLIATTTVVNKFIFAENRRKQMAIFEGAQDVTLRLRLQAYERLAMFMERIASRQLISRIYEPSMTVRDLQIAMTITIRNEFEHNLSQQIYVSKNVWETVKSVKEQELNMINRIAQTLNPEAHAKELHVRILEVASKAEGDLPTDVALQIINTEVKTVMQYGSY
jgi:hypothetical protein